MAPAGASYLHEHGRSFIRTDLHNRVGPRRQEPSGPDLGAITIRLRLSGGADALFPEPDPVANRLVIPGVGEEKSGTTL